MQPAVAIALMSFVLQSPNNRNEITVDYDSNTGVLTYRISRDACVIAWRYCSGVSVACLNSSRK